MPLGIPHMRILIAGGGTGGHLYPGIAIAEEFSRQGPDSEVLFVGTKQGIEARILPGEGYRLETIPAGGIVNKDILSKMVSVTKMIGGFIRSFSILRRFNPDVVIGVGGYTSAPMLSAAAILRVPTVILEQNLFPGAANRLLSRIADRVVVAFEGSKKFFKREVEALGNPVRRGITRCEYLPKDILVVFVFGGSQGSHTINKAVVASLEFLREESGGIQFIHQTGDSDYAWVKGSYEKAGFAAEVMPYVHRIEEVYHKAALVISRAGATTIAEITACGMPAILIPYPSAAHDHQRINAEYLESMGTAEEISEQHLSGKKIAEKIKYFLCNIEKLKEMSEKSAGLYKKTAAEDIVKLCRGLTAC